MDIRIGVIDNPREITVTLAEDADRDAVKASIDAAIEGSTPTLWFIDEKGREVAVAASRIAYVEIAPGGPKPIGFG